MSGLSETAHPPPTDREWFFNDRELAESIYHKAVR